MSSTITLGDIVKLRKGRKAQEVHSAAAAGALPYLQIDEVRGVAPTKYAKDPSAVDVGPDDLCIVWDGANAGTVGYGLSGAIGSTVARIRFSERGQWDAAFVGRLLQGKFRQLNDQAQARGATIPHVDKSKLEQLAIPRIDLDEQRRIAAILDKADAIRRKREQALALADDLLKSTFLDMFGDPVTNPMGWPTATLGDLGDVQGGLQVSRKRDANVLKRPYLRVANVFRDRLELNEIKMIGLTAKERERVALRKGDVLIVEGHGNPDEIGRSAVWDGSIEDCVHQNHLIRFRPIPGKLDPEYTSRLLNSTGGRLQLVAAGRTTSGLNTISTSKVKAVTIPVPPFGLQTRFHEFCDQVSALKSKFSAAGELGSDLFGSLSQRAFRGEL